MAAWNGACQGLRVALSPATNQLLPFLRLPQAANVDRRALFQRSAAQLDEEAQRKAQATVQQVRFCYVRCPFILG